MIEKEKQGLLYNLQASKKQRDEYLKSLIKSQVNVKPRSSKYKSKKITVDGITFDSQKEANRYAELIQMQRAGIIQDLQIQHSFELIPTQRDDDGKIIERKCVYVADFFYYDNEKGKVIVEDVKGYTDTSSAAYAKYVIKRKLMLQRYGVRITEI